MKVKTVNIESDVEQVIREAKIEGNKLTLQTQLTPQMYKKVMKVLELIGFKWNRSAKCHIGEGDSADKLREALGSGKVVNEKKTYQFFETPSSLAGHMVSLAGIKPGDRVLEPSAGKGSIITAIWDCPKTEVPPVLFAIELNPEHANFLKALGAELSRFRQLCLCVTEGDFLEHEEQYDRIVMNPPFNQDQAVRHVKHAYNLLLPGGRLVAIMAKGWMFGSRKTRREFKEWYDRMQSDGFASIPEELPPGTFKDSGTNVGTVLVVISKRR
jgi:phospholipid N-methyltransferase